MLGATDPYACICTFWSDRYDHDLEYAGYATRRDEFVVRGSLEERTLAGFYLLDGAVAAAVGLDRGGGPELDEDPEMRPQPSSSHGEPGRHPPGWPTSRQTGARSPTRR